MTQHQSSGDQGRAGDSGGWIHPTSRVHPSAIVEDGVSLGAGTAVWDHVHLRSGARLGTECILGGKTYIAYGVSIGDRCKINSFVYVCHGVTLEDGVMVGAHTCFTNDRTPRATTPDLFSLKPSDPDDTTERTLVRRGASLGARCVIGPGVEIGAFAMVGMGSVVTKDVPAHGLVMGNPARLVGLVDRLGRTVLRLSPGETEPAAGEYSHPDGSEAVVWPPDPNET